jgi:hypothetical protein
VLVYTTDPLIDSVIVSGQVTVNLWASSDALDTDFTAKLCDVYPDGRSMLVADGIVQARHRNSISIEEVLTPDEINRFEIDLWSTAVVFAPGHAIRLSISSSNYPRFETNPNTGEPFRKNTSTRIAHQTVYHDADYPSAITLPVVDSLADQTSLPDDYVLEQNYPNPFNEETVISIFIPEGDNSYPGLTKNIRLEIFDLRGRRLKEWSIPLEGKENVAIQWRGDDHDGNSLPSGIYFCRLTAKNCQAVRKMTLLR